MATVLDLLVDIARHGLMRRFLVPFQRQQKVASAVDKLFRDRLQGPVMSTSRKSSGTARLRTPLEDLVQTGFVALEM